MSCRRVHADAEHERPPWQHRLVDRVVDRDPADLIGTWRGGCAAHQLEQRRPEVFEDAVQAGVRSLGH